MYTGTLDAPIVGARTGFPRELSRVRPFRICSRSFEYPAIAASCALARTDVVEVLTAAGAPEDSVEAARLIASELFTNALIHHRSHEGETVKLTVSTATGVGRRWVILTVVDAGNGGLPQVVGASDTDESGRGLALVSGLGARVAGKRVSVGYQVRARLAVFHAPEAYAESDGPQR